MKKTVSILLMLGMLLTLLIPSIFSVSAEGQPANAELTFDDWKNPFAPTADKYTTVATTVTSLNGNPAAMIYPLKGRSGSWNHVIMPFRFERQKTYVISYDVAVTEQLGKETLSDAVLNPVVCNSAYSSENAGTNNFNNIQKVVTFAQGSSSAVTAGAWNHVEATVSIPGEAGMWWEPDSIGFWEDNGTQTANSTFVIDNLVIMEQEAFRTAYPQGTAPRTDDPGTGYDAVIADFNSTRYPALRSVADTAGNVSVTMRGDSVLTWKHKDQTEPNLYIPFAVQSGKTYRVGFDISSAAANPVTVYAAASAARAVTDENAALQKFTFGESDSFTLEAGVWKHVDLTLTASAAAKYFVLCPDAVYGNIQIDNFAIAEADAYPEEMPLRTSGVDSVLRHDFEDEDVFFFNALNSNRIAISVQRVEKSGVWSNVLKWEPLTGGQAYNKLIAPYCFTKKNTYVISFDATVYGQYGGAAAGDTQLALYSVYQDFTRFEDSSKSAHLATVTVKAGEWVHITKEVTIPDMGSMNYLGFCEFPGNANNGGLYIDNLTIAPKTAECTDDTHVDGIWTVTKQANCEEAGSRQLTCAVCGKVLQTEVIPVGTHIAGEWVIDSAATCTEKGHRHTDCTVCGQKVDNEDIPAAGHRSGKWVIDTPAASGTPGQRHQVCSVCDETLKTEEVAALPVETEPETTPDTTGKATEGSGCKSAVGAGFWAALSVLALAGFELRKKR